MGVGEGEGGAAVFSKALFQAFLRGGESRVNFQHFWPIQSSALGVFGSFLPPGEQKPRHHLSCIFAPHFSRGGQKQPEDLSPVRWGWTCHRQARLLTAGSSSPALAHWARLWATQGPRACPAPALRPSFPEQSSCRVSWVRVPASPTFLLTPQTTCRFSDSVGLTGPCTVTAVTAYSERSRGHPLPGPSRPSRLRRKAVQRPVLLVHNFGLREPLSLLVREAGALPTSSLVGRPFSPGLVGPAVLTGPLQTTQK